jgi:phospholipid transport system substrate-binding protein
MKKHAVSILCFLLFAAAAAPSPAAAEPSPTEDLRIGVDEVIRVLGDKTMAPEARRAEVAGKIHSRFDYATMSQFILGKEWKGLTEAQKKDFVTRFSRILENTYIGRVEAYTDEKVRYVAEDRRDDKARVDTVIVGKSAQIPVNYKVRLKDGHWYVYDVIIEGVSLIVNYQSTYSEIVRKDGFDGLLRQMDQKLNGGGGK